MIRVLIADDQFVVREGIKVLLEPMKEIEIVGFAENGIEVLELVQKETPDIILLDIEMPEIDGLTLTKKISSDFPEIKVIILSTHLATEYVSKALDFGAKGYISKSAVTQDLSLSIQLVDRGYSSIKHELITQVLEQNQQIILQYQKRIKELEYNQQVIENSNQKNKNKKGIFSSKKRKKSSGAKNSKGKNIFQSINLIISRSTEAFLKCLDRILFDH
ncbi:MAG: response regulator transcription factor [Xenococcaceae cyanobacterium MO_188.B19]|nr:response regulator transcription factor [Xenococcaceae cyanobacterium MO_188.B19]